MITAMVSPTDGPIGDSALSLDDGEARVLNQNDARPPDPEQLIGLRRLRRAPAAVLRRHLVAGRLRATRGEPDRVRQAQASSTGWSGPGDSSTPSAPDTSFPTAGPPCFLDNDLFEHNDFSHSPDNIFPDQSVFLALPGRSRARQRPAADPRKRRGDNAGRLRGDARARETTTCSRSSATSGPISRPMRHASGNASRTSDRSWPRYDGDLLTALRDWLEPLLELGDHICDGVGGPVLLDLGDEKIVIDFATRKVRGFAGEDLPVPVHDRPPARRGAGGGARD